MTESLTFSGGCQCGAVRYRITGKPKAPHICHCRMCQKAAGNYFMPLAFAREEDFVFTRGEPRWYHSSDVVLRGFCGACGTPLIYRQLDPAEICITLGSLDDPSAVTPETQEGVESRLPFFHLLASRPENLTTEGMDPGLLEAIARSNHQHPDHDTEEWPEEPRS
ncbi:GFA family protein [Martelella sp. HB161492]|uniref:GFA family protein n=1 Tax=Martelella sp. HB161492 TaxID=2720726 RepID=UPI00158FABF3|nr:GFA family protein [Martelella sp. HB161492]